VLGIRQASLYYYFPSKEVALEEVCARGVEGFFEAAAVIAAGPETARIKLERLIASHVSPLLDRRDFVKVFLNERQHLPPASRQRIRRWSRALERVIEEVLKSGMRNGEFRPDLDPRLVSLGLLGMLNAVPAWYGKEPDASIERITAEFARLALDGLAST
jgi:TetR/AcrR family transcriptional regulator, cholesterol catabolism regulator